MILTVTPNPCVDKTIFVETLTVGGKMRSERYACVPGGKGTNVARAVSAMGRSATPFVVVGGHPGAHVVDMIQRQDGIEPLPVWVAGPTRTVTTVLESAVHRQTAFFEPGSRVTEAEYAAIVETFRRAVKEAAVVTFNGTVCDPAIARLYGDLIPLAHEAGATTILDSYGPEFAYGLAQRPFLVKPNLEELEKHAGKSLAAESGRLAAIDGLHDAGVSVVFLSNGGEGAIVSRGAEKWRVTPPAIDEVNPVGSGDCLVAGLAIQLEEDRDRDLRELVRLGVAMGTANAMSWDIGHFDRAQIDRLMDQVVFEPIQR